MLWWLAGFLFRPSRRTWGIQAKLLTLGKELIHWMWYLKFRSCDGVHLGLMSSPLLSLWSDPDWNPHTPDRSHSLFHLYALFMLTGQIFNGIDLKSLIIYIPELSSKIEDIDFLHHVSKGQSHRPVPTVDYGIGCSKKWAPWDDRSLRPRIWHSTMKSMG